MLQGSKKGDGSSSSSSSSSMPSRPTRVWQPGVDDIEEGEELQCDPSAYNSLHAFHVDWPCLRWLFCHGVTTSSTTFSVLSTERGDFEFLLKGLGV